MYWLDVMLDASLKGTVVLGVTAAIVLGMRGASAALRHRVWGVALTSLLVLPLASIVLPEWQVGFLPRIPQVWSAAPVEPSATATDGSQVGLAAAPTVPVIRMGGPVATVYGRALVATVQGRTITFRSDSLVAQGSGIQTAV